MPIRIIPNTSKVVLDVQICFAGAPLLPRITNEIFFRISMVLKRIVGRTPVIQVWLFPKKNASGLAAPSASQLLKFGNLAILARSALDPRFCAAIFR